VRALLGALLGAVCCAALAQKPSPVTPKDFQQLEHPQPVSTGAAVEVLEFFYYGCPVCYETQPHVARWQLKTGPGVALLRVPAAFTESSESFARTFYALSAMGQVARLHWPLYDNHHFDGRQLDEEKNVVEWVAANGVDRARFTELRRSAQVRAQVDAARQALDTYGVKGVPTFVVDGKYLTSARIAGSVPHMMRTLEYLVERAASERRK
jgi:thiol:disulfide interchange protein DsbA